MASANRPRSSQWGRIFRGLLIVIPLGVLGNIVFTLIRTDVSAFESLHRLRLGYGLLAVALGLLPWVTGSLRLRLWTRFFGLRLSFRELLSIVIGSELGSAVTPTAIGGGYVKVGMLIEKGMSPGTATSLMTLGTLEDSLFFGLSIPLSLALSGSLRLPFASEMLHRLSASGHGLLAGAFFLFLLTGLFWIVRRRRPLWMTRRFQRVWGFLSDFRQVYFDVVRRGRWRFLGAMGLTALHWGSRYMVVSALFAALNLPVDPVRFYAYQWMAFTLAAFIPTPGGAGGVEAAFLLLYRAWIPQGQEALVTAIWRFFIFYFQLTLGSLLFLGLGDGARRRPSAGPEALSVLSAP